GSGVVPGMTEPKFSVSWSTASEITGWRSTPTVPPPDVPPPPPPDEEHAALADAELCGFGVSAAKSPELSSASLQPAPARTRAAGGDGSRQRGAPPCRAGRGCVLERPARKRDGARAAVEELDYIVLVISRPLRSRSVWRLPSRRRAAVHLVLRMLSIESTTTRR